MKVYLRNGKVIRVSKKEGEMMINIIYKSVEKNDVLRLSRGNPTAFFSIKDIIAIK